jgi:hypothetical protein
VKSQGVYVDILGSEQIKVPAASVSQNAQTQSAQPSSASSTNQPAKDIEVNHVTCSQSSQIAPASTLAAGESRQFEGTIRLPQGIQPTYVGRHAQHTWHIRGRLEAWGNDPDSGYQPLRVGVRAN